MQTRSMTKMIIRQSELFFAPTKEILMFNMLSVVYLIKFLHPSMYYICQIRSN